MSDVAMIGTAAAAKTTTTLFQDTADETVL